MSQICSLSLRFLCSIILSVMIIMTGSQKCQILHNAIAILSSKSTQVRGKLYFNEMTGNRVRIHGTIEGLTKGPHGMHVHQYGDLSEDCNSTGLHFDDHKNDSHHGARNDSSGHTGDFGNVVANETGIALVNISDSYIQLHGDSSVVGRALVIHMNRDDLGVTGQGNSSLTGNAGPPVGCGIVAWDD